MIKLDKPIKVFSSDKLWEAWLKKYHAKSDGVWLKFYKKASGKKSLVYAQALEVALCYGWIDSQAKGFDVNSYFQRFGPRRSKSPWSKINIDHIKRLIKAKRMSPAGLAEVARAKKDGRWTAAYDSQSNHKMPQDFLDALKKNKKASRFFEGLNNTNKYAIYYRVQSAKQETTRQRRIKNFVAMLARGEKLY